MASAGEQRDSLPAVIRGALAIALLLASSHAAADPKLAQTLADEADRLAKANDVRGAALKFEAAWKQDPANSNLFCNIGISFYKAADHAPAHLFLARCLEQSALAAATVQAVRAALDETEAAIRASNHQPVRFQITPPASVKIAELGIDEAFVGNRVVWLPFGTFHVTARADGFVEQTVEVVTNSKDPKDVSITLARAGAIDPVKPPPVPKPGRRSKVPAIVATVGTAAAFGVAFLARSRAGEAADLSATALDNETFAGDKSSVDRWNTTFAISGSLAVVGTAATTYLWYRVFKTNVEIKAGLGGGVAVMYRGRF